MRTINTVAFIVVRDSEETPSLATQLCTRKNNRHQTPGAPQHAILSLEDAA